ncbi:L,D-transpeptidase [Planktotalea arctica]|uniref:L,D-transpeptidase n=1 Tax=Planktotalea arctica TaxID=1481893 RepID=UPI0015945AAF|nr:L,D-transpeptidase [Planktotalea arctica]
MLRNIVAIVAFAVSLPAIASAASLVAKVDVSQQTMTVIRHGEVIYQWPVSTARKGKITPRGSYSPQSLSRYHKSSLYNNAPMPYSIFFRGNYAVHGTNQVSRLGRPASAGCVRLHTENAAKLFALVKKHGFKDTRIVVQN